MTFARGLVACTGIHFEKYRVKRTINGSTTPGCKDSLTKSVSPALLSTARDSIVLAGGKNMSQSIKEELIQILDRLSLDNLLVVLRFVWSIEQQATAQVAASAGVSDEEVERAMADFIAAAGCGHSGDTPSSLRIDKILYGRPETS